MNKMFVAEWRKLRRPAVLIGGAGLTIVVSVIATILAITSAKATPTKTEGFNLSFAAVAGPQGITKGFSESAGFLGLIILSLVVVSFASEFGSGTIRTLLLAQPRRLHLLAGKAAALLVFVAAVLTAAELVSIIAGYITASARGISTSQWLTGSGAQQALTTLGNAVLSGFLWALLGAALGLLLRSTPLALGVALAWLLPVEHVVEDGWPGGSHWFPGILLQGFAAGGDGKTPWLRAGLTVALYCVVLVGAATLAFVRRDVTA